MIFQIGKLRINLAMVYSDVVSRVSSAVDRSCRPLLPVPLKGSGSEEEEDKEGRLCSAYTCRLLFRVGSIL